MRGPVLRGAGPYNALADPARGLTWCLQSDSGNATAIESTPDPLLLVNLSVWSDAESLLEFVYRSAHTSVRTKRRDFFERFEGAYQVLWWVLVGHIPAVDEGFTRLGRLVRYGLTREAFKLKMRIPYREAHRSA